MERRARQEAHALSLVALELLLHVATKKCAYQQLE